MDIDPPVPPPSSAPKKSKKFTPKAPSRRKTGPLLPKNDDDVEADPELLRRIHERHGTRRPKLEKKSSVNVAMSLGAGSSSSIPLKPKDESSKNSPNLRETAQKSIVISNSLCKTDGDADEMLVDDKFKSLSKTKKKYRERWDPHSYYPITLPWRPLGSGDPEILNEHEFREEKEYDENKINSASELGLLEENGERKMILFKLPKKLPLNKQTIRVPVSAKGKEKADASNKFVSVSGMNELPSGHMGKMLVYKSGAIKFKLGDVIFDVSSGILDESAQDLASMDTMTKDCCVLGKIDNHAVLVPDLDSILDDIAQK